MGCRDFRIESDMRRLIAIARELIVLEPEFGHLNGTAALFARVLPLFSCAPAGMREVKQKCALAAHDDIRVTAFHFVVRAVARLLDGASIAAADPATLLTEEPTAKVRLIHGTEDEEVPIELSRAFAGAHPWAALTELPGTGHFEFLDPSTAAWAAVVGALRD